MCYFFYFNNIILRKNSFSERINKYVKYHKLKKREKHCILINNFYICYIKKG